MNKNVVMALIFIAINLFVHASGDEYIKEQVARSSILEAVIKRGSKYTQLIKNEIERRLNKMKEHK